MEFRILGPLEVAENGEILDLGSRKQRSLLALLLIHANRVISTDRILEELWGDDAEGKENAL
ncbi:MAG: helix-turn-helix domain-containing protein, partial [Actinomycetota bacterium]|nr:helix-turn-helix domain-containing protein [Actinomycetota bacterium]